ncbi:MAG: hypothetical protein KJN85_10395 [Maribacter sp.]|nr:hypothetical protein [Maribacter sp.]
MRDFLFVVTLLLVMGFVSHAQDNHQKNRITTIEKGLALTVIDASLKPSHVFISSFKLRQAKRGDTASIYMYKNTKIKRALAFMTRRDRPKLA